MNTAPMPRMLPVERPITVTSTGKHGSTQVKVEVRFSVWIGDQQIAEWDTKRQALAFIDGWEKHRTHTKELIEAALGVAP